MDAIKWSYPKKLQAQGFKSLKKRLISNVFLMWLGQVIENGRTRISWSFIKKVRSMVGILQNRGVSGERKEKSENVQIWKRNGFQSPEMMSTRIDKRWFCN